MVILDNHEFIQCDSCGAKIGYKSEDIFVEEKYSHDIFNFDKIKRIIKWIHCPNCMKSIVVSQVEVSE